MIPEEVENWLLLWRPEQDVTAIFEFEWTNVAVLREAITTLLVTHMETITQLKMDILNDGQFFKLKMLMASNPDTPHMVLEYLSRHSTQSILERIAENPNTPVEVLSQLAMCECTEVRAAVAENAHTPADLIKRLSSDENPDIRYTIAENAGTPVEVLQFLELDDNPYVSHRARKTLNRLQCGCVKHNEFRQLGQKGFRGSNARPAY